MDFENVQESIFQEGTRVTASTANLFTRRERLEYYEVSAELTEFAHDLEQDTGRDSERVVTKRSF